MRYFILFLLACSPLLASSQDSLVCIPPAAARWYLEASEERWVLREKDSLNQQLVLTLNEAILVKDKIIVTYQNDSSEYLKRETTFTREITLIREAHAEETAQLSRARNIGVGVGAGAIIGSFIPGVGTVAGGLIGGAVGWVSSFLKL